MPRIAEICDGAPSTPSSLHVPSAISQALRAIHEGVASGTQDSGKWPVQDKEGECSLYRIVVANDRQTRERAYALAYDIYKECGYVPKGSRDLCVFDFDAQPDTFTLLVEDSNGRDVATVTLVFDSPIGLPCDEIFAFELMPLRAGGRHLVEVTRLAMVRELACSKHLLLQLFNLIYIYAAHIKFRSDFVIEVNPRHLAFYMRLLRFEQLGPERPCMRVGGAPAVLLRLNLMIGHRADSFEAAAHDRTLFKYAYGEGDRARATVFLRGKHRPMDRNDAIYFGLEPICPKSKRMPDETAQELAAEGLPPAPDPTFTSVPA